MIKTCTSEIVPGKCCGLPLTAIAFFDAKRPEPVLVCLSCDTAKSDGLTVPAEW